MTMKFLVAVDGSDESKNALEHAISIAKKTNSSITVVHAVESDVYTEGGEEPTTDISETNQKLIIENIQTAESRGEEILKNATEIAEEKEYEIETELLYGDPTKVASSYAESNGIDKIFVGHKGLSDKYEYMVGSVAKTMVERSPVPVTVVR